MAQTRSKSASPKKKASTPRSPVALGQVKPKPSRKPRQCQRCPGRPLLSTCEHRYRKRSVPAASDNTLPVVHPTNQGPLSTASQPQDPFMQVIDPVLLREDQEVRAQASGGVISGAKMLPASATNALASSSPTAPPSPRAPSTTPPGSPSGMSPLTPRRFSTPPRVVKRTQPSGVNPKWGKVQGAGRGNDVWEVHRVRELKPPIKDQALATRKLERWTVDLISRAEAVSTRTGCWLYLAIQHPSSKTPFTHFTSRKLRNDAASDVELIHKQVRHTMNSLTRGHKRSMFEAEKELEVANAKASSATKRAERAEEELLRLKRILVAQGIRVDE
ncbi:hypothetical protein CC1G_06054 [Coprinopsis cinerea okayama7|uniref:Uncharacterized protein n=1 Tax=Coprinopsis cinerea (strain Okayama-7 / 130 / ATCC MYA-4618 / FGSC 9003) TaxID=240176 RepID=A8N4H7_COPC7|nr:hypothetical protein CC1G_06054 [Coprinopsis cinerea okayama7\|eukprot:XP_001829845.2 hypothetical protein CC1G_06054 [Coprinopsis cinerea okayama7\